MSAAAGTELPPDAYHDNPWTRLLPWLAHHPAGSVRELVDLTPAPDWWLTESPAVTTMAVDHDDLCTALARMFISRYPNLPFSRGMVTLPRRLPSAALSIGTRARTTLHRLEAWSVNDLADVSVADLFAVRGTGHGTVEEITAALVGAAITRRPEHDPAHHQPSDEVHPADVLDAMTLLPAQLQVLEDLTQLATWRHARGDSDRALFTISVEDGAPEEIQEAVQRINALTATDLTAHLDQQDPVSELSGIMAALEERQKAVLRERFLATTPKTLAEMGTELGLSSARVGQIERQLKDLLVRTFHFGTSIGNLLASIRVDIQPVASLDRLVERYPALARQVPDLEVPLWLVLDRLDDYFEVTGGWAAAPDVGSAREHTRSLLGEFASEHGVVDLDALTEAVAMPGAEFRDWLNWCGFEIHEGHVLTRTRSLGDHAAGLLSIAGHPLPAETILQQMGKERSLRSVANALASDERFVRADRTTWALSGWGVEEYTSIKEQIARELSAAGGAVGIADLVTAITGRFDVAPASVYAYASNGDFQVIDGVVYKRSRALHPRREPAATRRLFRHGAAWRLRLAVTRDHLRGSSFAVPAAVAGLVGCDRGATVELDSRLGAQTIRWTGLQPSSGTVRRFLEDLDVKEGQNVFLEFRTGRRFDLVTVPVEAADAVDAPLNQALTLIGAVCGIGGGDPVEVLAEAVGLPADTKPRRIISAYQKRGDDDVADLLLAVWGRTRTADAAALGHEATGDSRPGAA